MRTFKDMADKYLAGEVRSRYSEELVREESTGELQEYYMGGHEIEFLKASFIWDNSKYGFHYWNGVYIDLKERI
jgi:hypothetical protein